jgi:hypothetical protein
MGDVRTAYLVLKGESMALIDIAAVDRTFYADRIRYFLPDFLIDVHTQSLLRRRPSPGRRGP